MHNKKPSIVAALTGLLTLLFTAASFAEQTATERMLGALFSSSEVQTISDYYRGRYGSDREDESEHPGKDKKSKAKKKKGLPPGLAKRQTLPPGLAKQLKRNSKLPPGLDKRELPGSLESMLPERLPGEKRVLVDNDVVLIEEATGRILDILRDVF
jgi:hypothetical protein